MKPQMQWSYLFKHWLTTLLIAPFLSDLFLYADPANHKIGGLVGVYPIVLIFSFIFSVPTYTVYALVFYFLQKENVSVNLSKKILIAISVTGVFISFIIVYGQDRILRDFFLSLGYMLTSILTGIFFKLGKKLPADPSEANEVKTDY